MRVGCEEIAPPRSSEKGGLSSLVESMVLAPAVAALWVLALMRRDNRQDAESPVLARSETPQTLVESYYEYLAKGDLELAVGLLTDDALRGFAMDDVIAYIGAPVSVEVKATRILTAFDSQRIGISGPPSRWLARVDAVVRTDGDRPVHRCFICRRQRFSAPWSIVRIEAPATPTLELLPPESRSSSDASRPATPEHAINGGMRLVH